MYLLKFEGTQGLSVWPMPEQYKVKGDGSNNMPCGREKRKRTGPRSELATYLVWGEWHASPYYNQVDLQARHSLELLQIWPQTEREPVPWLIQRAHWWESWKKHLLWLTNYMKVAFPPFENPLIWDTKPSLHFDLYLSICSALCLWHKPHKTHSCPEWAHRRQE